MCKILLSSQTFVSLYASYKYPCSEININVFSVILAWFFWREGQEKHQIHNVQNVSNVFDYNTVTNICIQCSGII